MKNFHGIIFDLDGTLLNTLEDITDAANHALTSLGFPAHPLDAYRYFVGDGMKVLIAKILPPEVVEDEAVVAKFLAQYVEAYGRRWDRTSRPYPGVAELLTALASRNIKMAVLSNKPHAFTVKCVEKLLAPWQFSPILGQQDSIPRKPDPAGVHLIREAWHAESSDILYLGDTATDILTAKNAGCFAVGAAWGFRPESELREAGADRIAREPMEVLEIF